MVQYITTHSNLARSVFYKYFYLIFARYFVHTNACVDFRSWKPMKDDYFLMMYHNKGRPSEIQL